jgi:MYXO-CTERM domain-containing protein
MMIVSMMGAFGLVAALTADEASGERSLEQRIEDLRAVGLGQSRGMPVAPDVPVVAPIDPPAVKSGVIFVNFDAVTLTMGGESSVMNTSSIFGGDFEAYGDNDMAKAAVMEAVRNDWQLYDILVTDERPESGDYTMNVTSPTNPLGGGVLGIAPLDCFDMMTHNNVTFAFHGAMDGFPATVQATTIGQEVAHSFGLEHVDDPTDIMNPVNAGGDPSFKDECLPTVQGGMCGAMHEPHCGDMVTQNSHQELLDIFGTSAPDTVAPTVHIKSPANGAEFNEGAEFVIEAIANDDRKIGQLELFDGDESILAVSEAPYTWDVVDIPEGYYEFRVVATDPAGNEAESNVVEVIVGDPGPREDDDGGEDEDGSGTDAGQDEDGGGKGCGCGPTHAPAHFGWALVGLAAALRRRRPA